MQVPSSVKTKQKSTTDTTQTTKKEPAAKKATKTEAPKKSADEVKDTFESTPTSSAVAGAIGGTPAVHTRTEGITRHETAKFADEIAQNRLKFQETKGVEGWSQKKTGPVGAVVVDNKTGKSYTGLNSKNLPKNLHPVLKERIDGLDPTRAHRSHAGSHAEVHALNDALWARDADIKKQAVARGQDPTKVGATTKDLKSMTLDTIWTKTNQKGGMSSGSRAPRCANCTQITKGVHNLAGDSTMPYHEPKATAAGKKPAKPLGHEFTEGRRQGLRRGAVVGGLAGAGMSTVRALADGKITSTEALGIAGDATLGVITGAGGDVIEHEASRLVGQKLATETTKRSLGTATAKVAAGRLAGAGVAGAVIGAGFSTVDQIQAYKKGEVTASEAIGTVTAEAATGLAAGAAGAAAGAAVGSIIPVAGTAVGAVVGFAVGMGAGYLADKGLRATGVTDAIATGVTGAIDGASKAASWVGKSISSVFGW